MNGIGATVHSDSIRVIAGSYIITVAANRDLVCATASIDSIGIAIHSDVIISVSGGDVVASLSGSNRNFIIAVATINAVGVTADGDVVSTVTRMNGIGVTVHSDSIITVVSGDLVASVQCDFVVNAACIEGNVTSSAEVEFARRCGIDRAAGAFYLHNTAAGGIHCNCIIGCEVEFAA